MQMKPDERARTTLSKPRFAPVCTKVSGRKRKVRTLFNCGILADKAITRDRLGQSAIELCLGAVLICTVPTIAVDGVGLAIAYTANAYLAKNAARAAASAVDPQTGQGSAQAARVAANQVFKTFPKSETIFAVIPDCILRFGPGTNADGTPAGPEVDNPDDPDQFSHAVITAVSTITYVPPAPLLGLPVSPISLAASVTEPIVSLPSPKSYPPHS